MRGVLYIVVLVTTSGGCFSPLIADGEYACGNGNECPSGFFCDSERLCQSGVAPPGQDAGVATDHQADLMLAVGDFSDARSDVSVDVTHAPADVPTGHDSLGIDAALAADVAGDAPGATCVASPGLPADNFDNNVIDSMRWSMSFAHDGATMAEVGGEAVLTPAVATAGSAYAGYASSGGFDLTGKRVFFEVTQMVNVATNAQGYLTVGDNTGNMTLGQENGSLSCRAEETVIMTVTYDPVAQRWLQIREAGGTAYCEFSPDGIAWTVLAQQPTPTFFTAVTMGFTAGTYEAEMDPGEFHVDNFNVCPQ